MRRVRTAIWSGLYRLKSKIADEIDKSLPTTVRGNTIRFVPTVEIAAIYSKGGKVRKLHQLIVAPDFKSVSEINARLERIGNLKADGRPILGIDSKELLRLSLEAAPESFYIPAHIWTAWFGMFGSKPGIPFQVVGEGSLYEQLVIWATTQIMRHVTGVAAALETLPALKHFSPLQIKALLEKNRYRQKSERTC